MGPAPSGRSGHAMAAWQNKVFVLGGESYTAKRTDDTHTVHILDTGELKTTRTSARSLTSLAPTISQDQIPS